MHGIKTTILLTVLMFLALNVQAQLRQKNINWKFGLTRLNGSINYKYETQRMASTTAETISEDVSKSTSGSIATTDFMLEYVYRGHFGIEYSSSLSPSVRDFRLTDQNETRIGDVVEKVKNTGLYGVNFYLNDHTSGGIKFFFGVLTGQFSVEHSFTNGGDRDDDTSDTTSLYRDTQKSTLVVQAQVAKLGFDYIRETVGFRLQLLAITAMRETTSGLGETGLQQKQNEIVTINGGVHFGVFGVY